MMSEEGANNNKIGVDDNAKNKEIAYEKKQHYNENDHSKYDIDEGEGENISTSMKDLADDQILSEDYSGQQEHQKEELSVSITPSSGSISTSITSTSNPSPAESISITNNDLLFDSSTASTRETATAVQQQQQQQHHEEHEAPLVDAKGTSSTNSYAAASSSSSSKRRLPISEISKRSINSTDNVSGFMYLASSTSVCSLSSDNGSASSINAVSSMDDENQQDHRDEVEEDYYYSEDDIDVCSFQSSQAEAAADMQGQLHSSFRSLTRSITTASPPTEVITVGIALTAMDDCSVNDSNGVYNTSADSIRRDYTKSHSWNETALQEPMVTIQSRNRQESYSLDANDGTVAILTGIALATREPQFRSYVDTISHSSSNLEQHTYNDMPSLEGSKSWTAESALPSSSEEARGLMGLIRKNYQKAAHTSEGGSGILVNMYGKETLQSSSDQYNLRDSNFQETSPSKAAFMDELTSVVTERTNHSSATLPVCNLTSTGRIQIGDTKTIETTSSMKTEEVVNSLANKQHRRAESARALLLSVSSRTSGLTTNSRPSLRAFGRVSQSNDAHNLHDQSSNYKLSPNDESYSDLEAPPVGTWCASCGKEETHKSESHGPFGLLIHMMPQTVDGHVFKGYCLRCYDVYTLRESLNDHSIPLNLLRRHPNNHSSLRLLQDTSLETEDDMLFNAVPPHRRKNASQDSKGFCSNMQFQLCCVAIVMAIIGASVGVAVSLSKDPDPWVVPPIPPATLVPTSAPKSSLSWNLVTKIQQDDVESFGYNVELSWDGEIVAVTSPNYQNGKGRLDIFTVENGEWKDIGNPIVGGLAGDQLGLGMHLSGNGKLVAVGLPSNNAGAVKVYTIDREEGLLVQLGPTIEGSILMSQFGYSLALNFDGTVLFIGAPQFGVDPLDTHGLVQAYIFDGISWIQVGQDMTSETYGARFGHSISTDKRGNRLVVGAPLDDARGKDSGRIHIFIGVGNNWIELAAGVELHGSEVGSHLGKHLTMHCDGVFMAGGCHDRTAEDFLNAGVVKTWDIIATSSFLPVSLTDEVSGVKEEEHFGHGVDLNCRSDTFIMIASTENRNGWAGSTRVLTGLGGPDVNDRIQDMRNSTEFSGPKLGDTAWLGQGPSASIAGKVLRFAIGYESILSNSSSRSEVHIYDFTARE